MVTKSPEKVFISKPDVLTNSALLNRTIVVSFNGRKHCRGSDGSFEGECGHILDLECPAIHTTQQDYT